MKNLFTKLKKTNTKLRYVFYVSLITYLVSIGFMAQGLLLLNGIETVLRYTLVISLSIILLLYLVGGLVFLITKRHKWLIASAILVILFCIINFGGFYFINRTYGVLAKMHKKTVIYTTNLVAMSGNESITKVGMINEKNDIEGYILPNEYLQKTQHEYEIVEYEDYYSLLTDLYEKKIDAMFITENYVIVFGGSEPYTKIETETYVVAEYSKEMENKDFDDTTNKSVTEPFSILLIGIDSKHNGLKNNTAFNGDALILVTFNPKTLSATMFGIPRDTYVPIACYNNRSTKINAAAAAGTKCIVNTIENLVGFEIDYNVKINMKGLVDLVDALGGIEVKVPEPDFPKNYCTDDSNRKNKNSICLTPGLQTLDGEHALALARVRKAFAIGDFKRVQNQQLVIEAIAKKAKKIRSVNDFYKVLDAVSNNLDTNMSTKEMLNFYNVGKDILLQNNIGDNDLLSIQKTYLSGYDLTLFGHGYTFQYYEESLKEIVNAMQVNLGEKEAEIIKTFGFSVNKEYQVAVIGKNYSSAKRNEALPSFVGQSYNYLLNWNSSRNLALNKKESLNSNCTNGEILDQSVHKGTLVSSINSLTVTVCTNTSNTQNTTTTTTTTTDAPDLDLPDDITP